MRQYETEFQRDRDFAVSPGEEASYKPEPDQPDGLSVQRALSEADFKQGLDSGRIEHAVVVYTDPARPAGGQYVPYLRPSWREDYCPIQLYKGGLRSFRSFDALLGKLAEFGYLGTIVVLREGDPALAAEYRIGVDTPPPA